MKNTFYVFRETQDSGYVMFPYRKFNAGEPGSGIGVDTPAKATRFTSIADAVHSIQRYASLSGSHVCRRLDLVRVTEVTSPSSRKLSLSRDLCGPALGYVVVTNYEGRGMEVIAQKGPLNGHGWSTSYTLASGHLDRGLFATLPEAMTAVANATFNPVVPFSHIARVVEENTPGTTSFEEVVVA